MMPLPAVIHCTSPGEMTPRFPRLSPCSTSPARTYVIVSMPRCGCQGNPRTYSAASFERKSSRRRNGSSCGTSWLPNTRFRRTPAPATVVFAFQTSLILRPSPIAAPSARGCRGATMPAPVAQVRRSGAKAGCPGSPKLAKRRDHVLPEQLDRSRHRAGRDLVRLHQAEELVAARLAVALDLPDAGLGVAHDDRVHVVEQLEGDIAQVQRAQPARVLVAAELAPLLPGAERADQLDAPAEVPHDGLGGVPARRRVGLRAVDQGEGGGAVVHDLPGGPRLLQAVSIERDPTRQLLGRHADREGEEAEALLARDLMARGAGRGHPQRRVRLLERLRQHAPRRDAEVRALPGEHVGGPRADDHLEGLLPHAARLLGVDAEAFQLVARRGAAGAELEAPVAHAIEEGRHLGGGDRVVVGKGQETDAVADADRLRARRDRAVEHLGRGAVRELGEEVVLDGPEVREPDPLAEHGLVDHPMVRVALAPLVPRGGDRDLVEEAEVQTSVCLHGRAARDKESRMGRLDGKVAIVTGGASGIGAATVRRFVAEGARVVIADLNDEAGEGVARALGAAAAYRHADVGSLADLEAAVAFARERFGGLDVMHNNAAMSGGGYVAEIEPEVWEQSLRVMLTGVFYGTRAAIPALLARGGGSIISTSSVEGFFGEMMAAPYCTAKAGIINLMRTVALEYGRRNIRANCICPGAVDTPMLGLLAQVSSRSRAELAAQHAIGRILRPEEIANVALFLASDESSAITGAAIVADGGLTCGLGITGLPPYGG